MLTEAYWLSQKTQRCTTSHHSSSKSLTSQNVGLEWELPSGGKGIYLTKDYGVIEQYAEEMAESFEKLYVYTVKAEGTIKNEHEVGELFYNLAEKYGEDEASKKITEEYGIDGISYWSPEDGRSVVVFNPKALSIISVKEL